MATDNTERIDKFLRDQMTPEEIDAFLRDMELDEELRKEAQLTALMIQDLQERQAERDSEIIEEVVASKKKAKIVRMVRWTVSIAAIFLLKMNSPEDANIPTHEVTIVATGSLDTKTSYADGKTFSWVVRDSVYVYSVNGNDIRIKWFLALAFLKDGQKGKATELLSTIVKDDKGTYLKEEAEQLLKDIDKQ